MIDTKDTLSENSLRAVITLILPTWLEKLYILLLLQPSPISAPGITVWELYNELHVGMCPWTLMEQCNQADAEHVPEPLIPSMLVPSVSHVARHAVMQLQLILSLSQRSWHFCTVTQPQIGGKKKS